MGHGAIQSYQWPRCVVTEVKSFERWSVVFTKQAGAFSPVLGAFVMWISIHYHKWVLQLAATVTTE